MTFPRWGNAKLSGRQCMTSPCASPNQRTECSPQMALLPRPPLLWRLALCLCPPPVSEVFLTVCTMSTVDDATWEILNPQHKWVWKLSGRKGVVHRAVSVAVVHGFCWLILHALPGKFHGNFIYLYVFQHH